MDGWVSFAAGLVGALIGGAASFGVQVYISRRDTYARRLAAIERVAAASRAIIAAGSAVRPGFPNTEAVHDSIIEGRMVVGIMRTVLLPRELPVAVWLRVRMKKLAKDAGGAAESYVAAFDDIDETITWLAEWAAGHRKVADFAAELDGTPGRRGVGSVWPCVRRWLPRR